MELKFDKITVDTSLAQEYLKENNAVLDLFENFDNRATGEVYKYNPPIEGNTSDDADVLTKIQALTSSIKQNAALITQLEYHIRNIPIQDTNTQLNLIVQRLNYCKQLYRGDGLIDYRFYNFEGSLLNFGTVVQMLMCCDDVVVLNMSKATAVVVQFFIKLCRDAGFKVKLRFVNRTTLKYTYTEETIKGLDSGTVAIVSEDADVDSAVDTFLSVSEQAPWRLRRILVQESTYLLFKDALRWKCNLKKRGSEPLDIHMLCSETLTYNGKVFYIDPVDVITDQQSVVTVEAYRTRKEMISLIQTDKARYLSLWANDIAEINEVTHNTKSPVVWVNNIGDFRGPPQVSAAVFAYEQFSKCKIMKCDKVAKLCKLLQSWQMLDYEVRRDILCDVLDQCIQLNPENNAYVGIRSAISVCTRQSFVEVGTDYVCKGIWEPAGVLFYNSYNFFSVPILKSILCGNGFVTTTILGSRKHRYYDLLKQAGVPVVHLKDYEYGNFVANRQYDDYRVRVIWTNIGTII